MKNKKNDKKKKNKLFYKILAFILIIATVMLLGTVVYFNILPNRYLIPGVVVLVLLVLFICAKLNSRTCLFTKLLTSLSAIILIVIETIGILYIVGTISFFNKIIDTGYRSEVYNLYVLNDGTYNNLNSLKNKNIMVYNTDSNNMKKAITLLQNKINYQKELNPNIEDVVNKLLNKETDAIFISESIMQIYKEDHESEYTKLKIVATINVIYKNKSDFKTVDVTKDPFAIYLSGIDTFGSIKNVSRSDTNLLLFVNPKTSKVLIINTPRDYYVTLASKKQKDKLTHAGIYGIDESAKTLAQLYDTNINYYARVNYTSFVKIIDTLNGITVNSKYTFSYDGYSFKKGTNKLTGLSALAFSRGRKMLPEGDISRGYNQQAVIEALVNKMTDANILTKYTTILNSLKNGVLTNMEQKEITKLVNMQLKENIKWQVESYTVKGSDASATTYSTGSLKCYVMEPDMTTVNEAKLKIKNIMQN